MKQSKLKALGILEFEQPKHALVSLDTQKTP